MIENKDRRYLPVSSPSRGRGRIFRLASSRNRLAYIPDEASGRVTDYPPKYHTGMFTFSGGGKIGA